MAAEVQKIPLFTSDRVRGLSGEASVLLKNRYIEPNPILSDGEPSFISRPGLKYYGQAGTGPIRSIYQPPGGVEDKIFIVSDNDLYSLSPTGGLSSSLFVGIDNTNNEFPITWASVGAIGDVPPLLYFCDGVKVGWYTDNAPGRNGLSFLGATSEGDVVQMDGVYYKFTSLSLEIGPPDGSSSKPWLVSRGANPLDDASYNMYRAINGVGTPGVHYSTDLVRHPTMSAYSVSGTQVLVRSEVYGSAGSGLSTTETGADLQWDDGSTTIGGGSARAFWMSLPYPEDTIAINSINNYVIVVPKTFNPNSFDDNTGGRFFWVEPGETFIDPLNYATAERQADDLFQPMVFNDELWLCGANTTEVWYATGDQDTPFARLKGVSFDKGVLLGSPIQIFESMVVIDQFYGVWNIGSGATKISTPDIDERIRKSVQDKQTGTFGDEQISLVTAWSFVLDGHAYYVLRLFNETLVYDFLSQSWYNWGSGTSDIWNARTGAFFRADLTAVQENTMNFDPNSNLSHVLVGDEVNGALYFLYPQGSVDDNNTGTGTATFERIVYGQLLQRGRDYAPCAAVEVLGSIGFAQNSGQTSVTLSYSDDMGNTYTSAGAITVTPATFDTRLEWRSLGSMKEPGRIFNITDAGALVRIDAMYVHVNGT